MGKGHLTLALFVYSHQIGPKEGLANLSFGLEFLLSGSSRKIQPTLSID
jgi:hypothetical protein